MTRVAAALATCVFALSMAACTDRSTSAQGKPAPPPAVPVGAAVVEKKMVPVQVTAVGTVQAFTTVALKSQIAGQIVQVHFTEGQDVAPGQLLFTIDPRPMQAVVRQTEANVAKDTAQLRQAEAALAQRHAEVLQAQANLERDLAQLEMARLQDRRYRELMEKDFIAREQYDQVRTTLTALQATVAADRAGVENARASARAAEAMVENARAAIKANEAMVDTAKLNLGYTTIKAPMGGRTGNLLVQTGNVVKGNDDNPLVVIAQVRPIYVSFAVPEQHLAAIKSQSALTVDVMTGAGRKPVRGTVTFLNNTVDPTTGTIQMKATFPNTDNALWPGQFVDTVLTLATDSAIVVPARAVQTGQKGAFVFVVKPDSTVDMRPVTVGRRLAGELVIDKGLTPGERVVTDGQLRLLPGARVDVKPQNPS